MTVVHPKFTFRFHPRTGSTATSAALMTLADTTKLHHHKTGVPGPVTACTIRNPLDVMTSWYAMYSRQPNKGRQKATSQDGKPASHLSMSVKPQPLSEFAASFAVQAFVGPGSTGRMFYHLPTDVVLRWEHLEGDLRRFLHELGLPPVKLPHLERTAGKQYWRAYYVDDPHAETVLRERFPLDFEAWDQAMMTPVA